MGSAILIANPRMDAGHFFATYIPGTSQSPQALWYYWMVYVTAHGLHLSVLRTDFINSVDFGFSTQWPLLFSSVTEATNYS